MGILYINVLGKTRVTNEAGEVVEKLGGVKPRQVLEVLALSPGRPISKDRLAELLWDHCPPPSYLGTLESYVCVLRRALGAKGRDSALQTTNTGYLLREDQVRVDVVEARQMLAAARLAEGAERLRLIEAALGLLDEELLASEPYAPWAQAERASHNRELVEACTEAAESALELGEPALSLRLARLVIERDPMAERAWQVQMRALAADGRHAEALGVYASLREVMLEELGTEPSPASRSLYVEMLKSSRPTQPDGTDLAEVSMLIRLLRQALEAVPGVRVPEHDAKLTEIAVRVLAAA